MTKVDEQLAPWNGAAMVVFVAALVGAFILLQWNGTLEQIYLFNFIDVLIIVFATFRITHLITYDKILKFVRNAFFDAREGKQCKPQPGFRRLMCELLECIWCTSIWAGLIALTLYLIGPLGRFAAIILALAGAASLLQLLSKLVAARADE